MRIARKLTLLAVTAVAAMAMMASTASAVTVTNEGGSACSALVAGDHTYTGGCLLSASSPAGNPVELRALFGIMYLCDNVFTGRVNGNGEGFIYNQTLRAPGTLNPCQIQPQNESDGHARPWPAELTAENGCGAGCDTMEAVFSVTGPFGVIVNCHLVNLELRQASHTAATVKTPGSTHVFCENDGTNAVLGTWNVTSPAPGLEVG